MKYLIILAMFYVGAQFAQPAFSQTKAEEEYQKKLEAWKKQKEAIEKKNAEKKRNMGIEQQSKAEFKAGTDYYRAGDYAAAVRSFQAAIKLDPEYQKAFCNLGLAYKRLGDYASAEANYDKAMKGPDASVVSMATKFKANLFVDLKKYDRAIQTIDAYLKTTPDDDDMIYLKGKVMKDGLGKIKEAIDVLSLAVQKNSINSKAHFELANAYNLQRNSAKAIEHATKAINNAREADVAAGAHFEMAEAYRQSGDDNKAREHYTEAKKSRRYRKSAEYWIDRLKG